MDTPTLHRLPRLLHLDDLDALDPDPDGLDARRLGLLGYGNLLVEVTYGMPDAPSVLNLFVWETRDIDPHFPRLHRFLDHWKHHIEGPLRAVRYAHRPFSGPRGWSAPRVLAI